VCVKRAVCAVALTGILLSLETNNRKKRVGEMGNASETRSCNSSGALRNLKYNHSEYTLLLHTIVLLSRRIITHGKAPSFVRIAVSEDAVNRKSSDN
jgi:hypothetical protein